MTADEKKLKSDLFVIERQIEQFLSDRVQVNSSLWYRLQEIKRDLVLAAGNVEEWDVKKLCY